jgi:hypothetical protein
MPKRGNKQQRSIARGVGRANVSLASVLDQQQAISQQIQQIQDTSAQVQDSKSGGGGGGTLIAIQIARAQLQLQKESNKYLKDLRDKQDKQVEALQKGNKDWKGFGDKFKDFKRNMGDAFDVNNIKKKLLGPFTMFKGARDKIEDLDYIRRNRALGVSKKDKTDAQLREDSKTQRGHKEVALRAQDEIDRLRSKYGATDAQINASDAMTKRNDALAAYNKLNQVKSSGDANNKMGGNTQGTTAPPPLSDAANKMGGNTSQVNPAADAAAAHETQVEMLRQTSLQTDLLQAIVNNTATKGNNSSAGGTEDKGSDGSSGGILGGIGLGLKALGSGIKTLGSGAGKGIEMFLRGLARGAAALANPVTLVGLGAFTLAFMGIGKALQWAAPAIEAIAPVLMKVADVIGDVFMTAIKAIPDVIGAIGDVIMGVVGAISDAITGTLDAVVTSVERLGAVSGDNLMQVGLGLVSVAGGLAAFGAGTALAGLGSLVGSLLTIGQDSPIDQLQRLANMGTSLNDAANGINAIGQAMQAFGNIDKKQMDAINEFPWLKATAFVAAGGAMSAGGAKVYNASKNNADETAKVDAASNKGGGTTISKNVVQQNNNQTNVGKPSVRNTESSYSRYLSARY